MRRLIEKYADIYGAKLPALERNILKLRAMQMLLVIYYVEDIKRDVLRMVRGRDRLARALGDEAVVERIPEGTKKPYHKALSALAEEGVISIKDKAEIIKLIDYRNIIGHEMHILLGDMSGNSFARELSKFRSEEKKKYDYYAVDKLRKYRRIIGEIPFTHEYAIDINFDSMLFESAEKTLLSEITRLKSKIYKLNSRRELDLESINAELKLGKEFEGDIHPGNPLNHYDNGRLTARGEEVCYRLFDAGKSVKAVAVLMRLSLEAASKRRKMWLAAGGSERPAVDFDILPKRKFYQRYDD